MTDPDAVDAHATRQLARLAATPELAPVASDPALQQRLRRLAVASDFAVETLLRQPQLRGALAATGDLPDLPAPVPRPVRLGWPVADGALRFRPGNDGPMAAATGHGRHTWRFGTG